MPVSGVKTSNEPIIIATLAAIGLHVFIVLGISFDIDLSQTPAPERTLDITLVPKTKPKEENTKPDFLAQTTQQGGGDEISKARTSTRMDNLAATPEPQTASDLKPSGIQKPQPQKQPTVITHTKPTKRKVAKTHTDVKAPEHRDLAQILASTQKEIDRLTAELDNSSLAASRQLRRKAINANTQEYLYASYLDAWRKKVERIGKLNYPDAARRNKLYGSLRLHIAIRADGSLEDVRLVRTSQHKILDDAATRIVRMAAPFAPFPPSMRKQVDVLDITRTWQFSKGGGLYTR